MALTEAANLNSFNISRNNYGCFAPKIPNQASFSKVDEKITRHFEKSTFRVNCNCLDSIPNQRQTSHLANARRNAK
jgi:hypothetical protein